MNYQAPFGRSTVFITIFSALVMIVVPIALLVAIPIALFSLAAISLILPVLILVVCFWHRVTGYHVDSHNLVIQRASFDFMIPIEEIESITLDSNAMSRSWRLFGNGGLFGFYGRFRNEAYGSYRAFVTDNKNIVVVKTKTAVYMISPENAEKFVEKLNSKINS